SPAPWHGPIAGIRVGRIDGQLIAFPTFEELSRSDLNLIVACSRDAIVMVEAGANQMPESEMIDALMFAKEQSLPLVEAQERLQARAGKPKIDWQDPAVDEEFRAMIMDKARAEMTEALQIVGKHQRHAAVDDVKAKLVAALGEVVAERGDEVSSALAKLEKQIVRKATIAGRRIDGRGPADLRP